MSEKRTTRKASGKMKARGESQLLGGRLKAWRKLRGYPLKRVAQDMGVSISVLSEWENGKRFPSSRHLDVISKATGLPLCSFFYTGSGDCPCLKKPAS